MATDSTRETPGGARAENSIRPSKKLRKDSIAPQITSATSASSAAEKPAPERAVPEEVRQRFVQVKNRYYFPDGARAFTDRGTRLTTSSENTEVVRSLIQIAEVRGWSEVTVRGTERFRKEAWFAARLAGLEVRGYQPTEFEQGRLVRTLGRQGPTPVEDSVTAEDRPPVEPEARGAEKRGGLLTGRLADHGAAPYRQDPHEPISYFVKLETPRGERTIWGVDLERAFKESLTKPEMGDEVGLRAVRQEAVKVRAQKRDADGALIEQDLDTHRNRWIIEKRGFFEARAEAARTVRDISIDPKQAVKQHPELAGTYLQVHAAELAAKRLRDPEDRERFVQKVRSALADSVARGEPLPAVRMRERAPTRAPPAPVREPAPVRG
jgi:putative DNA primase/helicase